MSSASEPETPDARERLLAAAMDHVAQHGVGDLSLRGLAAALGTSHRMLIYHFGSREGLLIEVIRAVEAQQRAALAGMLLEAGAPPAESARRLWQRLADPALWPSERLFFEVYVQALQGHPHARPMLDGTVDVWVEPLTRIAVAQGRPEAQARAEARLGVAVHRGLLLDLLATGDRAAVDAAMERYIEAIVVPATEAACVAPRPAPQVRVAHTAELDQATLDAARALLEEVFAGDLDDHDWEHALGGVHALAYEDGALVGHGAVVQRRLIHGGRALRAGYVEGVGVRADRRGRGHGAAVMAALERIIESAYDIGALGATDMALGFYGARGWRPWAGELRALTPDGGVATPDVRGAILVLPARAPLDLSGVLTCDWRDGAVW
jgi:aminoglycoside 2'-N-acetyltransferase I